MDGEEGLIQGPSLFPAERPNRWIKLAFWVGSGQSHKVAHKGRFINLSCPGLPEVVKQKADGSGRFQ